MTALTSPLLPGAITALCLGLTMGAPTAQAADTAPTTVTAAGVTLTSQSVTLPGSNNLFPGGAAAQATNANCLTCHSAGMVLNQPALSKAAWQAEVTKMIKFYKAPINEADVPAIVDYLTSIKGKS
jgi:hypothetical protein